MNKKFSIIMILATFSAFLFISCGSGSESTESTDEEITEVAEEITEPEVEEESTVLDLSAGEAIYNGKGTCVVCHQATGQGLATFPPLANADYLLEDPIRAIKQTLYGASEPITVNGTEYQNGIMGPAVTAIELTDQEVVDVVNFILNSWGNDGGTVTLDEVAKVRQESAE